MLYFSIGAMEGLGFNKIKERLRLLLWPSMKANWMLWPAVQVCFLCQQNRSHCFDYCKSVIVFLVMVVFGGGGGRGEQ